MWCPISLPRFVWIPGGVLVLDHDFALHRCVWRVRRDGYVRDAKGRALHRLIVGAKAGEIVDHINGDPLDNRRGNLRICTQRQNLWNGSAHRDSTSKYRGVSWSKQRDRWRVQIQGKTIGYADDEHQAAAIYNGAARDRYGDYARLNVVREAGIEPARA